MTANLKIKRTALSLSFFGESSVGKTCIIGVFLGLEFCENHMSTIGIEKSSSIIEIEEGKKIKLKLWDTAGQERFDSISNNSIRSSQGAVVVFDLTNRVSFEKVIKWLHNIREFSKKIPIALFGNKSDLKDKRKITQEEIDELCKNEKLIYFETSAKEDINIKEGIKEITILAYKCFENEDIKKGETLKKEEHRKNNIKKKKC